MVPTSEGPRSRVSGAQRFDVRDRLIKYFLSRASQATNVVLSALHRATNVPPFSRFERLAIVRTRLADMNIVTSLLSASKRSNNHPQMTRQICARNQIQALDGLRLLLGWQGMLGIDKTAPRNS